LLPFGAPLLDIGELIYTPRGMSNQTAISDGVLF